VIRRQGKYAIGQYRVSLVRDGDGVSFEENQYARQPADGARLARAFIPDDTDKEHFGVLFLNVRRQVIGFNMVSIGCLTASLVHPREVFKPAILASAAAVILAHNHPSGDPEPSAEDVTLTRRLVQGGELLGIEVLDHVVLGLGMRYVSFKDRGMIS
jgi:DNA repair protein RadC